MSIKFRSRIFRKPAHWSNERYENTLKEKNLFRNRKELNDALNKQKGTDGGKDGD